jgi:hypothetical protein
MIAIINDGSNRSTTGVHGYKVQINDRVICTFEHVRESGLAECLRRAADAVEASVVPDAGDRRRSDEELIAAIEAAFLKG